MIYKRGKHWHLDVTINGVRYRETLLTPEEPFGTTDHKAAKRREKERIAEIHDGRGASPTGRDFARKPFGVAADVFLEDRKPHVSERTHQLERNLLVPLRKHFGERALVRIKADDIGGYQRSRRQTGISRRTLNMEVGVLRQLMKRAKIWNIVAEDVKRDKENTKPIGRVLAAEEKKLLFETAGSKDEWLVVYCAAVLAVNTTCRGVELKHLRWRDVDLFDRVAYIRRSKTKAGHRPIPLNTDAMAALSHLRLRATGFGSTDPEHYVFPACQRNKIDATKPQKTWRTAWRSLVKETAKQAGRAAVKTVLAQTDRISAAKAAYRRAAEPFKGLRFHNLRHQAITELAENGASDATIEALAGHMSRQMLEHYSHVRMVAKRQALESL
jgi:integrase